MGYLQVNILDYDGTVQDLSFAFIGDKPGPDHNLPRATWTRSQAAFIELRFLAREYLLLPDLDVLGYHIAERMEIWIGEKEGGDWVENANLWAGYIRIVEVQQDAGEVVARLTLDTYNLLFKKPIQSFPDPTVLTTAYHSPIDGSDVPISGGGPGWTPKDWLIGLSTVHGGTKQFDGLVRQALKGNGGSPIAIDFGGVPDIPWALVTFDESGRPSNTAIFGYLEILSLEEGVQAIADLAALLELDRNAGLGVLPAFYMKTIVDPDDATRLKPQFVMGDLNDPGSVVATFNDADTTPEGDEGVWFDFSATKDGTDAYDSVTVIGVGGQFAGFDTTRRRFTRILSTNQDNRGYYLNRFSTTPGFELQIFSDTITTIDQANQLADYIAVNVLGGRRSCSFGTYTPVQEGELIRVIHQATQGVGSTGQTYVVNTATRVGGVPPVWRIEAGDPRPALQDILNGPLARLFSLGLVRNPRGRGLPNLTNPALPKGRALTSVAGSRFSNSLQAADAGVSSLRQLPATAVTKLTADGQPIAVNATGVVNYIDNTANTTEQRPVLCDDLSDIDNPRYATILPAPQRYAVSANGTMQAWEDASGQGHPELHVYTFTEDSWQAVIYGGTVYLCRAEVVRVLDDDTGALLAPIYGDGTGSPATVTIADVAPSLAVSLKVADPVAGGAYVLVDPPVDGQNPLRLQQPQDGAQVHVAGVPSGARVEVAVSEEGLDYGFFLPLDERDCP
jgi:hypothetical protein